jgi:hypothetical protein
MIMMKMISMILHNTTGSLSQKYFYKLCAAVWSDNRRPEEILARVVKNGYVFTTPIFLE